MCASAWPWAARRSAGRASAGSLLARAWAARRSGGLRRLDRVPDQANHVDVEHAEGNRLVVIDLDENRHRRRLRHGAHIQVDIGRRIIEILPIPPIIHAPDDLRRVRIHAASRVDAQASPVGTGVNAAGSKTQRCLIGRARLQTVDACVDRRDVGPVRIQPQRIAGSRMRLAAAGRHKVHLPRHDDGRKTRRHVA